MSFKYDTYVPKEVKKEEKSCHIEKYLKRIFDNMHKV